MLKGLDNGKTAKSSKKNLSMIESRHLSVETLIGQEVMGGDASYLRNSSLTSNLNLDLQNCNDGGPYEKTNDDSQTNYQFPQED